jgi:type IV pilus assembly protein PilB
MKIFSKNSQHQDAVGLAQAGLDDIVQIPGLSELYFPEDSVEEKPAGNAVKNLLDVLLDIGKISVDQKEKIARTLPPSAFLQDNLLEKTLLDSGLVSKDDILQARAALYGYEFRPLNPDDVNRQAFEKLDIDFIKNNKIVPVDFEENLLVVATCEPANILVLEEVKKLAKMDLRVRVCRPEDIENVCNSLSVSERLEYDVDDIISDMADVEVVHEEENKFEDLEKMAGQSPIIKFVNYLISNAIHDGASDIHIEPKAKNTKIRYRIDGVLFEIMQSPLQMHPAIVSRIKIMANLDISERRLPQDGKISVIVGGKNVDLRVSVLPTSTGEKVVIRILESKSILRGLEQLGMEASVMEAFKKQIDMPHGIFLVTGPTGSGKSTTLYSAIAQMDGERMNISTVEDPVEYKLDFCNQVQISDKIGLTFASSLRSLLRQDPDIIMIGEIRDNETARIAVQAALTGHLVLSTLHTNDAPSSLTRLVDIGIDAFLIAASLNGVLAQRLVRKICPDCKLPYNVSDQVKSLLEKADVNSNELYYGKGCDKCRGSGYLGRIGIYEMLVIDEAFRDVINKDPSVGAMRKVFRENRGVTLFEDGMVKVKKGLTTVEEVLRVTEIYGQNREEVFVENIA